MEPGFFRKIFDVLSEPFASWAAFFAAAKEVPWPITSLRSQTGWLYLLSSLAIAYAIYRWVRRRGEIRQEVGFAATVFPRDIYLHRSAIVDYKFVLFDRSIRMFLYVPLFSAFAYEVNEWTLRILGPSSFHIRTDVALWILPIYAVMLGDFSLYVAHRLMHQVPFLWAFHEVHHSAEVLTPATGYRIHPVEELVTIGIQTTMTALSAAFFTSVANVPIDRVAIFGVNALTFGFYLFAFQLRHSHVWLSYGPWLSRVFISPAQHQIHHSVARQHWNRNYGFMFAVWDLLLGSLYVPKEREQIVFGCGADPQAYSTLRGMYFTPFGNAWIALRRSALGIVARGKRAPQLDVEASGAPLDNSQAQPAASADDRTAMQT